MRTIPSGGLSVTRLETDTRSIAAKPSAAHNRGRAPPVRHCRKATTARTEKSPALTKVTVCTAADTGRGILSECKKYGRRSPQKLQLRGSVQDDGVAISKAEAARAESDARPGEARRHRERGGRRQVKGPAATTCVP